MKDTVIESLEKGIQTDKTLMGKFRQSNITVDNFSISEILDAFKKPFDKKAMSLRLSQRDINNPDGKYYGMSAEEIQQLWQVKADNAISNGHLVDEYSEYYFTKSEKEREIWKIDHLYDKNSSISKKCQNFDLFMNNFTQKYDFLCRELPIYVYIPEAIENITGNKYSRISARFDAMFRTKDTRELLLVDYKNNSEIKKSNSFNKMLGPMSAYDECDLNRYTLQLYIYCYIMDISYGIKDLWKSCYILHVNENNVDMINPAFAYNKEFIENCITWAITKIAYQRR